MQQFSLGHLEQQLTSVDLEACSEEALVCLVRGVNQARRTLDGYLARIAGVCRQREQQGSGAPTEDVLRSGGEVSKREADRLARRSKVGDTLPLLGASLEAGQARPENVDAVARLIEGLNDGERERLAFLDGEITDRAQSLPPEIFSRFLGRLAANVKDPDEESRAEGDKARSKVSMGRRSDGMWWLSGLLDPERGAEVNATLAAMARKLAGDDTAMANTRADALHRLICRAPSSAGSNGGAGVGGGAEDSGRGGGPGGGVDGGGRGGGCPGGGGSPGGDGASGCDTDDVMVPLRLGIGYIVDMETLLQGPHDGTVAQTWAGEDHDPLAVGRLACDCDWYGVRIGPDGLAPVGQTRRTATRAQRLALRALYRGCPLDGTPFDQCEIHHIVPYAEGGATDIDNLIPLSTAWHHRIHDRSWRLTMSRSRSFAIHKPDGTLYRQIPPPTPITRQRE